MTGETTVHVTQKKTAAVPAVAAIKEEDIVLLRQWLCKMEAYVFEMSAKEIACYSYTAGIAHNRNSPYQAERLFCTSRLSWSAGEYV
ncbi:hypothetical protein X801_08470 [Opisthorchis viverrini]|uniref:Uncharacterized protein n=1 Tax=Opisthorchis viverrini TaxID=6198 RepID=A0A1S8WMM5_OPIVI|nr:hypothetical protein X801_08470 [Opisthorchis viverrini]